MSDLTSTVGGKIINHVEEKEHNSILHISKPRTSIDRYKFYIAGSRYNILQKLEDINSITFFLLLRLQRKID